MNLLIIVIALQILMIVAIGVISHIVISEADSRETMLIEILLLTKVLAERTNPNNIEDLEE